MMDKFFDWMQKHFSWIVVPAAIIGIAVWVLIIWGGIELIAFLRSH